MPDRAGELHVTRIFDAPRALVFQCMIDPAHLTHFWGPAGVRAPLETIRVDARPGGAFETVMVNESDGTEYPTRAIYDEIRPPELLVWTEVHTGMQVRSEFVELSPGRTEVRIHQTRVPEPFLLPEAQAGFLCALDRLAEHLTACTGRKVPQ
jgi:uncharacterized protein YndB with AHSA1/START domain